MTAITNEKNKDGNFGKLLHLIIDSGIWAMLSPKAKAVYGVHLRYVDFITRVHRYTVPVLAKAAGIHKSKVYKANEELVKWGILKMWMKDRRWYYYLPNENDIRRHLSDIYPPLEDRHRQKSGIYQKDKKTGKFIKAKELSNTDISHPQIVGTYPIHRQKSGTILEEIDNRDMRSADAAANLKGPASASPVEMVIPGKLSVVRLGFYREISKSEEELKNKLIKHKPCLTEEEIEKIIVISRAQSIKV